MRPHYTLALAPESEPITTDQASEHVRVDSADDVAYLGELIAVAREYADGITGRVSSESGWLVVAESWDSLGGDTFPLFRTPLVSIESISYYAPDAATLTVMDPADYRAVTTTEPGMVQILAALPAVDTRPDAIQVAFAAGYADAASVPPILKHAVKMLVAHFYEQRVPVAFAPGTEIPYGLRVLLENQKIGGWCA